MPKSDGGYKSSSPAVVDPKAYAAENRSRSRVEQPGVLRAESRARLQALGVLPPGQEDSPASQGIGGAGLAYDEATLIPGAAPVATGQKAAPLRSGSGGGAREGSRHSLGQTMDELAQLLKDKPLASEKQQQQPALGPEEATLPPASRAAAAGADEVTLQPEVLTVMQSVPRSAGGSRVGSRRSSEQRDSAPAAVVAGKPPLPNGAAEANLGRSGSLRVGDTEQNLTALFDQANANKAGDTAEVGQQQHTNATAPLAGADATKWPTEKRLQVRAKRDEQLEQPLGDANLADDADSIAAAEQQARQLNLRSLARDEGLPSEDPDVFGPPSGPPRQRWSADKPRVGSKPRPDSQGDANPSFGQRPVASPEPFRREVSRGEGKPPSPPRAPVADGQEPSVAQQLPEALRQKFEQRDRRRIPSEERAPDNNESPFARLPSMGRQASNKKEEARLKVPASPGSPTSQRSSSVPYRGANAAAEGLDARRKGRPQSRGQSVDVAPRKSSQSPGAEDSKEEGGRQMFDKGYLRLHNKDRFSAAIAKWREERCRTASKSPGREDPNRAAVAAMLSVYVRKRPLFDKDEKAGDYDAVTVLPGTPFPTKVVLHNCLFEANLKTPFLNSHTFSFDRVFGEDTQNKEVYDTAAAPLVASAMSGRICTMFMFGQTGSGKTHTMSAIEEMAAEALFADCHDVETWMQVQFVELCGNNVYDLLVPIDPKLNARGGQFRRPELKLREAKNGCYVAEGAVELPVRSPKELVDILRLAASRRATSATDANSVSSRSHAVCTLQLGSGGRLLLVDCAGTERRKDSMHHSKERQTEGAEINASLHSLKECMRYLTTKHHVPNHVFRASALTKVLADAFVHGKDNQLAVICTASPGALDIDHTLSTLRTGASLCPHGSERDEKMVIKEEKVRVVHPKNWTPEKVTQWLSEVANGEFRDVALPSNFTGQMLVRLTEVRFTQYCDGNRR
eukprot:CAMPEP_0178381494 /NCGR_PEP_ID=MMETSP0689_2-20121128/6011_1 /TAXON_ID=160604 /ORGANISM="Amphidinium massartii, Strain CS-259" /LENGTH=964 /DNA_ID=CAMNT_0020001677 /DNA_START=10 /DNA_END=2902 /DNA_ORIENTATION=+